MKASLETSLVCAAALTLGAAIGPLVSAKPVHQVLTDKRNRPIVPLSEVAVVQPPISNPAAAGATLAKRASARWTSLSLSSLAVENLADRCAPTEPAKALVAIARVESGFHPFRIRLNGAHGRSFDPSSAEEAVRLASDLIASGQSVDLGLAQINSRNLRWLNLSVENAFDPCRNLAAAGQVLARGYRTALRTSRPGQSLLHTAYSLYNTGDPARGIANGYADRIQMKRVTR